MMKTTEVTPYNYQVTKPAKQELLPFIGSCVCFSSLKREGLEKYLWPGTNILLVFNFRKTKINHVICPDVVVVGLHETVYLLQPDEPEIDTIIVHLTGVGFSLFSEKNATILNSAPFDATEIFGDAITNIFDQMELNKEVTGRQNILDDFFNTLLMKNVTLRSIQNLQCLTCNIQSDPGYTIPSERQLSYRHLSRIFKQKTGVNIQTYRRLSRFAAAVNLLIEPESTSLTDIGYQSGYYDQAHFAHEFKKLSGVRAKYFGPLCTI